MYGEWRDNGNFLQLSSPHCYIAATRKEIIENPTATETLNHLVLQINSNPSNMYDVSIKYARTIAPIVFW